MMSGFCCVNCGSSMASLYIQYSPGNIRLTKCSTCKAVADEYIEAELMIVFIDLVLHRTSAYRHLFFNMPQLNAYNRKAIIVKSALALLILDACRIYVLDSTKLHEDLSRTSTLVLYGIIKGIFISFLSNAIFLCIILLAIKFVWNSQEDLIIRASEVCMAILFSSYFKLFLIGMMVWQFPKSAIFIIDAFVLSSNAVAMKAMTNFGNIECIGVSFFASIARFLTIYLVSR